MDWLFAAFVAVVVVCVGWVGVVMYNAYQDQARWDDRCLSRGGAVTNDAVVGGTKVHPDSGAFCLRDGKILDVR